MSSEADLVSLLRRCHLEPESALARQVVADWLEENGTTEAEAALAEVLRKGARDDFQHLAPGARVPGEHLKAANKFGPAWLTGLTEPTRWGLEGGLFALALSADRAASGEVPRPALVGEMAWVARLRVEQINSKNFPAVLASLPLDGFHGALSLDGQEVPNLAEQFAAQPWLRTLTGLAFNFRGLQAEFSKLCRLGPWGEVVSLYVPNSNLETHHLQKLADSRLGQHLRLFGASENKIGGPGMEAICRSSPGLFALHAQLNRIDTAGVLAISELRSLRWLNLYNNPGLTLRAVEALANGPCAESLHYLNLAYLHLGDEACRLFANGRLRNLARLDVSGDQHTTADGVRMMVESANLPSLVWLGVPSRLKSQGNLPSRKGLKIP
jgi:hypothetical protein